MRATLTKEEWIKLVEISVSELKTLAIKQQINLELENDQPNIKGERFLMSGKKVVLIGRYNNMRAVIKYSNDKDGIAEMKSERENKKKFLNLDFIKSKFSFPPELFWYNSGGKAILISEFIEQGASFISMPNSAQFKIIIKLLESLEGVYIITSSHLKQVNKLKDTKNISDYINQYDTWMNTVKSLRGSDKELMNLLQIGKDKLAANYENLRMTSNYLTHTDLVPHNFRYRDGEIYFLDHTSLTFGNKYENWARMINFMSIYNRELESNLVEYIKRNRRGEEYKAFRAIRYYKLLQLIEYNAKSYEKSEGDLKKLCESRIKLFKRIFAATLNDTQLSLEHHTEFIKDLESYRAKDEIERQKSIYG